MFCLSWYLLLFVSDTLIWVGSILFEMPIDEEFTEMLRLAVAYGADLDERCSPFPYSGRTPVEYWQERVTHARLACINQAQALISALVSVWREDLVAPALLYLKTLNTYPIVDTHNIKELVKVFFWTKQYLQ